MDEVTHIVPVGHTPETLIESLRRHPLNRVVFIVGNKPERKSEQKAQLVVEKVKEALGSLSYDTLLVDPENVFSAAILIAEKIKIESKSANVKVNLSGSLRTIGIAAYIAGLMTKSEAYVGVPEYKDDKAIGVSEIVNLPLIPVHELTEGKQNILKAVGESEKSLDEIVASLNSKVKVGSQEYVSEKSRISHHLKDLKDKFIETDKDGRNLRIKLTQLGKLYLLKN